jgi:hypothetical protein
MAKRVRKVKRAKTTTTMARRKREKRRRTAATKPTPDTLSTLYYQTLLPKALLLPRVVLTPSFSLTSFQTRAPHPLKNRYLLQFFFFSRCLKNQLCAFKNRQE